jgi:hypothetical protein
VSCEERVLSSYYIQFGTTSQETMKWVGEQ